MNFAFDGQTLCSPDADRGIGVYFQALLNAMPNVASVHELSLFTWGQHAQGVSLPAQTSETVRNIALLPGYGGTNISGNDLLRRRNSAIRAAVKEHQIDCVFNPNSLQLHVEPVSRPPSCALVSVVHDLTPIALGWTNYGFPNKELAAQWFARLDHLRRNATMIVTDSETSRQDVLQQNILPPSRVVTIHLGVESTMAAPKSEATLLEALLPYQLAGHAGNYILSVGGYNPKKNVERLFEALGLKRNTVLSSMPIVFAGPMNDEDWALVLKLRKHHCPWQSLVRAGYVSREVQSALYAGAACLAFPSLHEGFGLPALEAMACSCPVLGSNNSSIPEVTGDCALLVDPFNTVQIAGALEQLCIDRGLNQQLRVLGLERAKLFTYQKTAEATLAVMEQAVEFERKRVSVAVEENVDKSAQLELAWFSPLPPDRGGVALYSHELISRLRHKAKLTLVTDHVREHLPSDIADLPIVSVSAAHTIPEHTLCVYNIMNNTAQGATTYANALRRPGLSIIHDLNIHGFLLDCFVRGNFVRGNDDANLCEALLAVSSGIHPYTYALSVAHGRAGAHVAEQVLEHSMTPDIPQLPCHGVICRHSKAVMVHGQWAVAELLCNAESTPVFSMNLGIEKVCYPDVVAVQSARDRYGIPDGSFVIVCGGYLESNRRLDVLIKALSYLLSQGENVCLLFAGAISQEYRTWLEQVAVELLSEQDVQSRVIFTGFIRDDSDFIVCLALADVVAHLRYPTNGETSATLLRAMAVGKPTIVSDCDNYHELPGKCCFKVRPEHEEAEMIAEFVQLLIHTPELKKQYGENAKHFIGRDHDKDKVADDFLRIAQTASVLHNACT